MILAAGLGSRLKGLTKNLPKSLLPITESQTYLDLQIHSLTQFSYDKLFIVGGFEFETLKNHLQNRYPNLNYEIFNNKDFQSKGNLYSLDVVLPQLKNGFLVLNADHYYSFANYQKFFGKQHNDKLCIFCDRDRALSEDDMLVERDEKLNFKQMSKTLKTFDMGYVGVSWVSKKYYAQYCKAFELTKNDMGDKANIEMVMNQDILKSVVKIVDISGSWWTEIDTHEDYIQAKKIIAMNS